MAHIPWIEGLLTGSDGVITHVKFLAKVTTLFGKEIWLCHGLAFIHSPRRKKELKTAEQVLKQWLHSCAFPRLTIWHRAFRESPGFTGPFDTFISSDNPEHDSCHQLGNNLFVLNPGNARRCSCRWCRSAVIWDTKSDEGHSISANTDFMTPALTCDNGRHRAFESETQDELD